MHRLVVDCKLANYSDMVLSADGLLAKATVRRRAIRGIVSSRTARLVIPKALAHQLGLRTSGEEKVIYADGRRALRDLVEDVYVQIQGRWGTYHAIVEPKRKSVIIGRIILNDLDFLIDSRKRRLVPRDPRFITSEL